MILVSDIDCNTDTNTALKRGGNDAASRLQSLQMNGIQAIA